MLTTVVPAVSARPRSWPLATDGLDNAMHKKLPAKAFFHIQSSPLGRVVCVSPYNCRRTLSTNRWGKREPT